MISINTDLGRDNFFSHEKTQTKKQIKHDDTYGTLKESFVPSIRVATIRKSTLAENNQKMEEFEKSMSFLQVMESIIHDEIIPTDDGISFLNSQEFGGNRIFPFREGETAEIQYSVGKETAILSVYSSPEVHANEDGKHELMKMEIGQALAELKQNSDYVMRNFMPISIKYDETALRKGWEMLVKSPPISVSEYFTQPRLFRDIV